ncbi:Microtubule-associated protein 4 [Myotis brandtii]|uniref:Microtubule-associated protein 4 n=1 Tax=Myotis brandtii TaxID=109478 RepID=S7MY06_MYOBR|nr:Microtubule-associated protein 4 [Myotis brandtii]
MQAALTTPEDRQLQWCRMADLSLADALTEPPPEIEGEIKRDFIATLEAEAYDDVVGETVGKTDYIPLLDGDEKTGNSESKKKPCPDTSQVEGAPSPRAAVLANGDHGTQGNDTAGSPTAFLEEKMAFQGYQNNQNWPENTNFYFEPEQVVNPIQTDPYQMRCGDGLEDLLFFPGGANSASALTPQGDPLRDGYGHLPCDTFTPEAVVPQGWPVEAPHSPQAGVFISPEATPPLQPTAEPAGKRDMASEERASTRASETMMGLKAADTAPSRETEMALPQDMAPVTETETLATDVASPTKEDVSFAKNMDSPIESDVAVVTDVVLPIESTETPAKGAVLFRDTERAPPIEMDAAPAEGVVSLTEREMALAKDIASPTAKELALSSGTEVALGKDMAPPPETEVALGKDMAPPPEIEVPVKDMAPPPETEVALGKDMAPPPETEVAPGKDVPLLPEPEPSLAKDVAPPSETEVAPVPVKDVGTVRTPGKPSEGSQFASPQNEGPSAVPAAMLSPEPVTAVGQTSALPPDEASVPEKLEQRQPLSRQPPEPPAAPSERKTDAARGPTAARDSPSKRSDDGKSKKVKNSFSEKHILENKTDAAERHVPMEATGDHRIEGMGYVDENRNITFTCPRTPSEVMSTSAPPEAVHSAACEKLPTPSPQLVKGGEAFTGTLAEIRQGTALAQISEWSVVGHCSKDGVPEQERALAASAARPRASPGGGALTLPAATETGQRPGDRCPEHKEQLAEPVQNEAGVDGGRVGGESESVPRGASKRPAEEITEPAKGPHPTAPTADHSPPERRGPGVRAGGSPVPASPVNREAEAGEGSASGHTPDFPGDGAHGPLCCEDPRAEGRASRGPGGLNKEMEVTLPTPKSEKDKREGSSLAPQVTESAGAPLPAPELQSDFFDGRLGAAPSSAVEKLVVTACQGLQLPEPKDKVSEAPEKMTEKSEPKALGEGKKEEKRVAEPMKGYMRPTKSRGLAPLSPKSAVQERERPKHATPSGRSLPGAVCVLVALSPHQRGTELVLWFHPDFNSPC